MTRRGLPHGGAPARHHYLGAQAAAKSGHRSRQHARVDLAVMVGGSRQFPHHGDGTKIPVMVEKAMQGGGKLFHMVLTQGTGKSDYGECWKLNPLLVKEEEPDLAAMGVAQDEVDAFDQIGVGQERWKY